MHYLNSLPRRWGVAALVVALLFAANSAQANTNLNELRSAYLESERLLKQKKVSAWLKKKRDLKQYPLYHYLIIREVRATHSQYTNNQIAKIISRVDVPLPGDFKRWWLERLKNRKDWDLIIKYYANSDSKETRCTFALAVLRSEPEEAKQYLEPLWLAGRSQPKQCDPLFESALKNGMIDDPLIWKRILLTVKQNQQQMTNYLRGLLRSNEVVQWVDQLKRVRSNPRTTVNKNFVKWSQSPYGQDVIKYGLERITRKDPSKGFEFWKDLKSRHPNTASQLAETEKQIAQILAWRRHRQAYDMLASLPESLQDTSILQLMIRNALARERWPQVLKSINRLPEKEAKRSEWKYWRARALYELDNREEAEQIFTSLAGKRDFYGMLSADWMGTSYNLSPAGHTYSIEDQQALLESEPAMERIREWLALRKPYSARRELTHLANTRKGDVKFWSQAALLFHAWGWHDGAIRSTFSSGRSSEFHNSITHPTPYISYVRREAIRNGVPQHWTFGIMRQESLFVHDIRSGAGAIGLMQLLPSTARVVAKRHKLKRPSTKDLSNGALNIRLGTSYFKGLLNNTDGNLVYSLAGYNAGPRRVKQWRKVIRAKDPAAWVESIPFRETRNYIKKILVNFIVYENILEVQHARIRDYL